MTDTILERSGWEASKRGAERRLWEVLGVVALAGLSG